MHFAVKEGFMGNEVAMKADPIRIRTARPEDAEALLQIYAPYVRETAITFEYEVPTEEEFRRRIETVLQSYPYLVAERDGAVLGYAYAHPFHERAAYYWTAEASIYLAKDARGQGLGRKLYETLETLLARMGVRNLYACVAYPEQADEYLDGSSAAFHAAMGYRKAGHLQQCGYKFGRWYGMLYLEKFLGSHEGAAEPLQPFLEEWLK